jgi:hypothetical protein
MEQKKLDATKLDIKKKAEEMKKMPDNTIIIGNKPLMNYLMSANYMCGETYDREKGINIQWDETHEHTAKSFIDVNLKRHGFIKKGEIQRIEFDDFEMVGKKEVQRHRVFFVQNVKLIPAIEP